MTTLDIVIRHGTIIDGTGGPSRRGDVGVKHGRVVEVGNIEATAARQVDAEGYIVAPGFIDAHTHMDAQVHWAGFGESPAWHGVTTAVMGNCGFTLAPCRASEADLAIRSLERAEDIAREAILAGVTWSWETYPEFLDAVEQLRLGINYAGYIGHSALRTYVMGERAFDSEATADEIALMCRELDRALAAGAVGFSTSRSLHHLTLDGRPVASRLAAWGEVEALVGVMARAGHGVFQLAPERDAATADDFYRRLRTLTIESGRPVTFMMGGDLGLLEALDEIAAAGGNAIGQVNVRAPLSILSFLTRLPFDRLPAWAALRRLESEAKLERLRDPAARATLVEEAMTAQFARTVGADARPPEYSRLYPLTSMEGPYQSVQARADERGTTPVDVMIDLAIETGLQQLFFQPPLGFSDDAIIHALRNPNTVVAASDAGAHVSQIMDSGIPTYLLAHWVRSLEALTWEQAVRALTSRPAELMGFHDRGLLRPGYAADVVIFDPATVGPMMPTVKHDLPDGGARLCQKAQGVIATFVNGVQLTDHGEPTGSYPGRLLRVSADPGNEG